MRVAWDLQAVTGPGRTGLGVSVQFMLDALLAHAPDIEVAGLRPNKENKPLCSVVDRLKWEQWRLPRLIKREMREQSIDLAYSPALGAPLNSPVPVIAHVHDLIPLVDPRQFTGVAGWYWKRLLPFTWKRCRALTVSNQTVADEIAEHLNYPLERIHVVPYYPDPAIATVADQVRAGNDVNVDDQQHANRPSFVTLASHEPRKNIELAIKALARVRRAGVDAQLTCIGGHTPHTASLRSLAAKLGVGDAVTFPGYLEREETVRHLLCATALLFVSRYEGFGMPPLEAMSIGCPVVLSDIPCLRHIYADPARYPFLPADERIAPTYIGVDDDESLAGEMLKLAQDAEYRLSLVRTGPSFAATFTAPDTAAALRQAYQAALS